MTNGADSDKGNADLSSDLPNTVKIQIDTAVQEEKQDEGDIVAVPEEWQVLFGKLNLPVAPFLGSLSRINKSNLTGTSKAEWKDRVVYLSLGNK